MKTVILSGVVLILIIISIIFGNCYTAKKAAILEALLNDITNAVESDNWEECGKLTRQAVSEWGKTASKLAMIIHHHELKSLSLAFAGLKAYVEQNEKADAIAQISILEFELNHIVKKDKVSFENIF